jgi:hypothetical protein
MLLKVSTGIPKRLLIILGGTKMLPTAALATIIGLGFLITANAPQTETCIIEKTTNGAEVKFRGEVFSTAHDVFIRPQGCTENRIIMIYGDNPSLGKEKLSMRRDEAFLQFEKFSKEEQPPKANEICKQCPRYRVIADFEGRLDIAASAGWKRDSKTGEMIGVDGFGHPRPFTRYRLVVTGISNVEAIERTTTQSPEKQ